MRLFKEIDLVIISSTSRVAHLSVQSSYGCDESLGESLVNDLQHIFADDKIKNSKAGWWLWWEWGNGRKCWQSLNRLVSTSVSMISDASTASSVTQTESSCEHLRVRRDYHISSADVFHEAFSSWIHIVSTRHLSDDDTFPKRLQYHNLLRAFCGKSSANNKRISPSPASLSSTSLKQV